MKTDDPAFRWLQQQVGGLPLYQAEGLCWLMDHFPLGLALCEPETPPRPAWLEAAMQYAEREQEGALWALLRLQAALNRGLRPPKG